MKKIHCPSCDHDLPTSKFYKKRVNKSGEIKYQSQCKSCFNAYCIKRWIKRKKDAIEYKGGECEKCGYDKYYGSLEFHHRNPKEKDAQWDKLRLKSWDAIKKEIDKCDLVCRNCHGEIHGEIHAKRKA